MSRPRSYYKVTDQNGKIILDNTSHQKREISVETAAIMTKLLETVVDSGTANRLISLDKKISVAGKTGTTQGNCDRFFVGYTPELLAGTWFGYEYPKSLDYFGGNYSAIFWDEVVSKIYSEYGHKYHHKNFKIPDTVQQLTFDSSTGEIPISTDEGTTIEEGWFNIKNVHIYE